MLDEMDGYDYEYTMPDGYAGAFRHVSATLTPDQEMWQPPTSDASHWGDTPRCLRVLAWIEYWNSDGAFYRTSPTRETLVALETYRAGDMGYTPSLFTPE